MSVLLEGAPNSGKTALAASLAKQVGTMLSTFIMIMKMMVMIVVILMRMNLFQLIRILVYTIQKDQICL